MARNATPLKPRRERKPTRSRVSGRATGALARQHSWRDRFDSWRDHHRDSARDALRRMKHAPAQTLMTVLVIAIALALPASLYVMLGNARDLTRGWDGNAHLSVFLKKDVTADQQQTLADQWRKRGDIDHIQIITPDQALAEFKQMSGYGDVLKLLPDNPLPPVLVVFPKVTAPKALENLRNDLSGVDGVDRVQLDVQWVRRLNAMIAVGVHIIWALGLALAAGVLLVVVNTIRLAIESRRDEIVVVKLVGGTDGFVRRPFLYTGWWTGLAGGLGGVLLVEMALFWIGSSVQALANLYGSKYSLTGLGPALLIGLPVLSGLLGLLGAWLAVARHLRDIEPNPL